MRRAPILAAAFLAAATGLLAPPSGTAQVKRPKAPPGARLALEGVNEAPGWGVRVSVDREDRKYKPGDAVTGEVVSERAGFLYLFNIDTQGEITLLLPGHRGQDNAIAAMKPVRFGDKTSGTGVLEVDPTHIGVEYLKAVVTRDRVPQLDALGKKATAKNPLVTLTAAEYDQALRAVAFRGAKDAPNSGNLTKDIESQKNRLLKLKIVPKPEEEFKEQTHSWAEHQLELYTGNNPGGGGPRRRALVIGIDKYLSPNIRPLRCAVKDAKSITAALESVGKFDSIVTLTDSQATLENIRAEYAKIVQTTQPGDTVLVYWAGHGGRCANTDGTEPDKFDEFLVTYDGVLDTTAEIQRTMLLDKAFGRWVMELTGRKVMVVLDTCHSGGQVAGTKFPEGTPPNTTPRNARGVNTPNLPAKQQWTKKTFIATELTRYGGLQARNIRRTDAAVLASCAPLQFAFEKTDRSNGVMTSFLLEALDGKQRRGSLSLKDAFEYVDQRVQKYVEKEFPGSPQTPVFSDDTGLSPPAYLRP